jgi:predicted nucleotidyltransferase
MKLCDKITSEIINKITANFNVRSIILFGSNAKISGINENSDIDLIIVLNEPVFFTHT